jgi:hypothetical protein
MTQCRNNGINLNPEKCAFYVNSRMLLGHIVYEDGLLVDLRENKYHHKYAYPDECDKVKKIPKVVGFY